MEESFIESDESLSDEEMEIPDGKEGINHGADKDLGEEAKMVNENENPKEEEQYIVNENHMVCKAHKRKVEFVYTLDICMQIKHLCTKCYKENPNLQKYSIPVEDYLKGMMKREKQFLNERNNEVADRANQMRRLVKKITKSIDQMEKDELLGIQNQLEDINLRQQTKVTQQIDYYSKLENSTHHDIQRNLLNKQKEFNQLQQATIDMQNLIERKEFDLRNLLGVVVEQDNLLEIASKFESARKQDLQRKGLQDSDDEGVEPFVEGDHFYNSFISDIEKGKTIVTFVRLSEESIVFCNNKTIYYYNFLQKKITHKAHFKGNVWIMKVEKITEKKIALLLYLEFKEHNQPGVITFDYEIYILDEEHSQIKRNKVFIPDKMSVYKDIYTIKNSLLLLVVLEDASLIIINSKNSKMVSRFNWNIDAEQYPFQGIVSCTLLYNYTLDNQSYKQIIAINLIDGTYGFWDFISNKFHQKNFYINIIQSNYTQSVAIDINEAFSSSLQLRKLQFEQNLSQQQYLILIQGKKNETIFQRDFDGELDVKFNYQMIPQYFDLFYNKSAVPFYHNSTIFFYDVIDKERLKTINISTYSEQKVSERWRNEIFLFFPNFEYVDIHLVSRQNQRYQAFQRSNSNSALNQNDQNNRSSMTKNRKNSATSNNYNLSQQEPSIISSQVNPNNYLTNNQPFQQQQNQQSSFSQHWDQQLQKFHQNQKNIKPTIFQQNQTSNISFNQQNNQKQFNNDVFLSQDNHNLTQSQRSNSSQSSSSYHNETADEQQAFNNSQRNNNNQRNSTSQNNQNNYISQNNHSNLMNNKVQDICPIAIVNHYEHIILVFPNGIIQYIK